MPLDRWHGATAAAVVAGGHANRRPPPPRRTARRFATSGDNHQRISSARSNTPVAKRPSASGRQPIPGASANRSQWIGAAPHRHHPACASVKPNPLPQQRLAYYAPTGLLLHQARSIDRNAIGVGVTHSGSAATARNQWCGVIVVGGASVAGRRRQRPTLASSTTGA